MSAVTNTFEKVKALILSVHKGTTSKEKIDFYNRWAENYDQVRSYIELLLLYRKHIFLSAKMAQMQKSLMK